MHIFANDCPVVVSERSVTSKLFLLCAMLLCLVTARAEVLQGRVISVSDGDTVGVLDSQRITHRVRLSGIDAPEHGQGFSQRSKQHLAGLIFDRAVEVEWSKRDRYGRIVGKVLVDGMDVCREMIAAGFAWHYKAYESEQSLDDRANYSTAENMARQGGLGIWHESNPVPPWEYRAWRRTNAVPQSR